MNCLYQNEKKIKNKKTILVTDLSAKEFADKCVNEMQFLSCFRLYIKKKNSSFCYKQLIYGTIMRWCQKMLSMCGTYCKKDITPVLMHWSYISFALTHCYIHVPLSDFIHGDAPHLPGCLYARKCSTHLKNTRRKGYTTSWIWILYIHKYNHYKNITRNKL